MRGRGEGKGRKERGKEEVREDVGKKDGDGFKVLGRSDLSEIRGCSQLVI